MTLSSTELCERTGASYRQLSHWTAVGYIPETMWYWEGMLRQYRLRPGHGSGFNRRYDQDAVRLCRALTLVTKVAVGLLPYVAEQVARQPYVLHNNVVLRHPDIPQVTVMVDLS